MVRRLLRQTIGVEDNSAYAYVVHTWIIRGNSKEHPKLEKKVQKNI